MWVCPKCKSQNHDSLNLCWWCHTEPDGTEHPRLLPRVISRMPRLNTDRFAAILKQSRISRLLDRIPKPAGMPRQFGIGHLLIMIALFGVMFSLLKILHVHPIIYIDAFLYLCGIAIAQVVLFNGKRPRMASCIGGFVMGLILGLGTFAILFSFNNYFLDPHGLDAIGIFLFSLGFIFLGGPIGYLAGCLIAGIFLVREQKPVQEKDDMDK